MIPGCNSTDFAVAAMSAHAQATSNLPFADGEEVVQQLFLLHWKSVLATLSAACLPLSFLARLQHKRSHKLPLEVGCAFSKRRPCCQEIML